MISISASPSRTGIFYSRVPSRNNAKWKKALEDIPTRPASPIDILDFHWATFGQPGVAVGDFNGAKSPSFLFKKKRLLSTYNSFHPATDEIDEIYATNGPGAPNLLFISTFPEIGRVRFRDITDEARVSATSRDSTGVCYGDLNGDGHIDLIVLGE